jgi:hypothetical protein
MGRRRALHEDVRMEGGGGGMRRRRVGHRDGK